MLLSHQRRFIYLKTVKTGGTSVEIYFEPYCVDPELYRGEQHNRPAIVSDWGLAGERGSADGTWYNHMPASRVRELVGEEVWNGYFKFCVVRNPFDKVVSQFWYQQTDPVRAALNKGDFNVVRKAFWEWCRSLDFPADRFIYTVDGMPAVDHFIRYERLPEGLDQVCRRLEIPWEPHRLGRYKSGYRLRGEHFAEYYNPRTAALVRAEFAWELDYFQYSADTPAAS